MFERKYYIFWAIILSPLILSNYIFIDFPWVDIRTQSSRTYIYKSISICKLTKRALWPVSGYIASHAEDALFVLTAVDYNH